MINNGEENLPLHFAFCVHQPLGRNVLFIGRKGRIHVYSADRHFLIGSDFHCGAIHGAKSSFNASPGPFANIVVNALAIQNDGKILLGGGFSSYNGVGRNGIARIFGGCTEAGHPIDIAMTLEPEYHKAAAETMGELRLAEPMPPLCTLVAASEAVIAKLGYSTLAEAYHAGVPFGFFPVISNFLSCADVSPVCALT